MMMMMTAKIGIRDENFSSFSISLSACHRSIYLSVRASVGEDGRKDPNLSGNLQSWDIHHHGLSWTYLPAFGPKLVPISRSVWGDRRTRAAHRRTTIMGGKFIFEPEVRTSRRMEQVRAGCLGLGRILDFPSTCEFGWLWCCPRLISEKANEIIG